MARRLHEGLIRLRVNKVESSHCKDWESSASVSSIQSFNRIRMKHKHPKVKSDTVGLSCLFSLTFRSHADKVNVC